MMKPSDPNNYSNEILNKLGKSRVVGKCVKYAIGILTTSVLWGCQSDTDYLGWRETIQEDAGTPSVQDADIPDISVPEPTEVPKAKEPLYVHTADTLYTFDVEKRVFNLVGKFFLKYGELKTIYDIAITSDGRLFAGTQDKKIYIVNPKTAEMQLVFTVDDLPLGMTFIVTQDSSGLNNALVVAGIFLSLWDIQKGTKIKTIKNPNKYRTSGDVVGLNDGKIYWTVKSDSVKLKDNSNTVGDYLVRIDPETNDMEVLGRTGLEKVFGLGYAYDDLYAFSREKVEARISQSRGELIDHNKIDLELDGATTNPVVW